MTDGTKRWVDGVLRRFGGASLLGRLTWTAILLSTAAALCAIVLRSLLMEDSSETVVATVLAVMAASLFGSALGIIGVRGLALPLARLADRVKRHDALVRSTSSAPPYHREDDPLLPTELRDLEAGYADVLEHLRAREEETLEALAAVTYARESLGIVVDEAAEASLLLEDGSVTMANMAAAAALGRARDSLPGHTLGEVFSEIRITDEDGAALLPDELLERAAHAGTTARFSRADLAERWYLVHAVRREDDSRGRVLLTARDFTEERRLGGIREEILSLVMHDLRAPLSVVVGYLDLLGGDMSAEQRDRAISAAKDNAARMNELLEDLLAATHAEELLTPAALLPVPAAELVEEVVDSLSTAYPKHRIDVDLRSRPLLRGEHRRLRQALVNLITNALRYSPTDSPITVRLTRSSDTVYLRVVDHGPGVATADRDHVFDRFARIRGESEHPGIGLGLYIVRVICENHGGGVQVEETPGGGATFTITLPAADRDSLVPETAA